MSVVRGANLARVRYARYLWEYLAVRTEDRRFLLSGSVRRNLRTLGSRPMLSALGIRHVAHCFQLSVAPHRFHDKVSGLSAHAGARQAVFSGCEASDWCGSQHCSHANVVKLMASGCRQAQTYLRSICNGRWPCCHLKLQGNCGKPVPQIGRIDSENHCCWVGDWQKVWAEALPATLRVKSASAWLKLWHWCIHLVWRHVGTQGVWRRYRCKSWWRRSQLRWLVRIIMSPAMDRAMSSSSMRRPCASLSGACCRRTNCGIESWRSGSRSTRWHETALSTRQHLLCYVPAKVTNLLMHRPGRWRTSYARPRCKVDLRICIEQSKGWKDPRSATP
eukprot:SAG11_NODE_934_length_6487_cov_19.842204_3_plen_333_part_00